MDRLAVYVVRIMILGICLVTLIFTAPTVHNKYLVSKVGLAIVTISPPNQGRRGGTGFHIATPKGPRIITNRHVCDATEKEGQVEVYTNDGRSFLRRILGRSKATDLCMIEALEGYPALKLGRAPKRYDTIMVIGHPLLERLTPSSGIILSRELISLQVSLPLEQCVGPSYRRVTRWFFPICIREYDSYATNVKIYPGNSGSPTLNFWGNVVAVAFASSTITHSGYLIPFTYLDDFVNYRDPGQSQTQKQSPSPALNPPR